MSQRYSYLYPPPGAEGRKRAMVRPLALLQGRYGVLLTLGRLKHILNMTHSWERKLKPGKKGYAVYWRCKNCPATKHNELDGKRWTTYYEDASGHVSRHAGKCAVRIDDPAQLSLDI